MRPTLLAAVVLVFLAACDDAPLDLDAGPPPSGDAGPGSADAGDSPMDAGDSDAGDSPTDGGVADAGPPAICPPGTFALDLSGVSLAPVAGVPIDDGFADGFSIVEGPVWARGALYVSHFPGGEAPPSRIYRVDPSGDVTIAAPDAGVNGLALGPDGRLYGGRHADGSVSVFDWDDLTATPTAVVSTYMDARFNSPNDLAIRSDGTLYFSDPGWQSPRPEPQAARRAYRVEPDGTIHEIPDPPDRPNGVTLTADERTLFISGTDGLRRYELDADGAVTAGPMNVDAVSGGLDGLGLDCAGNLYVTGGDQVVVLDPSLSRVGSLSAPGATNVAFGGADRRTLYVTTLGSEAGLLSATLNVPGYPY